MKTWRTNFSDAVYLILAATLVTALGACAHHRELEQKVDQETQATPAIPPGPALSEASREMILDAPNLKPEQKRKLERLRAQTAQEMDRLRAEIGQSQLVLVKNLVNPKVGLDKLKIVQNRIFKLEQDRTELWLRSLDEANRILGRRSESDEKLYRAFILTEPETIRNSPGKEE